MRTNNHKWPESKGEDFKDSWDLIIAALLITALCMAASVWIVTAGNPRAQVKPSERVAFVEGRVIEEKGGH